MINYNNQNYLIDITEVATPSGQCNAVSIVETDVSVEFERPLDMPPSPVKTTPPQDVFNIPVPTKKKKKEEPKEEVKEEPKFQAFTGSGRRLDGKNVKLSSTPPSTSPIQQAQKPSSDNEGGMVFGSSKKPTNTDKKTETKTEDTKFKAFSGTGRSLK
jgi:ubiquitin fusion degradation protein 1